MVVKGPSVYLVLVNMKYNTHTPPLCSPLKAAFMCSNRSGSLGNLITRLKALSIRQITHSVWLCVYMHPHPVQVGFQAYMVSVYACVGTGCPLSTFPESPVRQWAGRNFNAFFLTQVRVRLTEGVFDQVPSYRGRFLTRNIKRKLNLWYSNPRLWFI